MNGKRIVVTGAASGIGAETARLLAEAGAEVVAVDLRPGAGEHHWHRADLGDPESIDALVAELGDAPVDGLCNIAGVSGEAAAETLLRVNFLGLRHLSERLVEERMPRGGAVVNAASFTGAGWRSRLELHRELALTPSFDAGLRWLAEHPVDEAESYPYAKELLIVWTQLAALAWMPRGVRVNAVSPGPVETPLLDSFRSTLGERVQVDIDRVGRPGEAAEIAPVIRFLCSDEARWINGANLPLDGGLAASFAVE